MFKKSVDHDLYVDKLTEINFLQFLDKGNEDDLYDKLMKAEKDNDEEGSDIDEEIVDFEFTYNNTNREQSKFYQAVIVEYNKSIIHSKNNTTDDTNHLYLPAFITYLLNELLPYFPLWLGLLIKRFGIRRNSNAAVESWNKIIKRFVFDSKMRQLIPRAINTLQDNASNRLLQRKYNRPTSRQKRNEELRLLKLNGEKNCTQVVRP